MDETTARRMRLVARLKDQGAVVTPAIAEAMRQIPRHLFVSPLDGSAAYRDQAVMVKYGEDGTPLSSVSQPTMVATMLEWLQVTAGHRVLEVGTGTGYNAALLAVLAGREGSVVSIELEPDLADRARAILAHVVNEAVDVVIGDGRDGYLPRAPYDRVIVTTGATEVAPAWDAQLTDGGRLVVPIVDRSGVGSIVLFDKIGGRLERGAQSPCGFLPIRGAPRQQ